MPDEDTSQGIESKGEDHTNPIPPPKEQGIASDAKQEGTEEEGKRITKLEDRIKNAEKWMIWFTGAIAVFGLCSVVVGVLQWSAIESGSMDTHNLAVAAQTQAQGMGTMSSAANRIQQAASNMVTQEQRIADNAENSLRARYLFSVMETLA